MMTVAGISVVVLVLFLLVSGRRSDQKTVEFYRRYYTREELELLATSGSKIAKEALR